VTGGISRFELRRLAKELFYDFCQELGVPIPVAFPVTLHPYTRAFAIVSLTARQIVPIRWLRVNVVFLKFFEVDPEKAMRVLKFTIAHEAAHFWQRMKYGFTYLRLPRWLLNHYADKIAEELTGVSKDEESRLAGELLEAL